MRSWLHAVTPPFRLDPHDFILPGELPPLMVEDELVFAGMQFAIDAVDVALGPSNEHARSRNRPARL